MASDVRTITDAINAVQRHVNNGRAAGVDEAAARATQQHAARGEGQQTGTGGQASQQG